MTTRPGHLLLICHDLQAASLAGSRRARTFIKYLSQAGWRVTVVTTAADPGPIPGSVPDLVEVRTVPFAFGGPIWRKVWRRLIYTPDPHAQWLPKAWPVLEEICRTRRPDVVLVTTPPHSLQALGVRLHRELGLPFVADFRDDWTTNHQALWRVPWHRWTARRQEAQCVAHAARVLLNTEEVRRRFAARFPDRTSVLSVLTNGYDEADFQPDVPAAPLSPNQRLRIYYAGASHGSFLERQLGGLASELTALGLQDRWEIVSLGAGAWHGRGHPPIWRHLGRLSSADAARELEHAAVLLLPMPPGEREPSGTVPLKTYGYLRSHHSIVYLGERGSTTELLGRFPGTHCLPRSHWTGLGAWLEAHRSELARHHARPGLEAFAFEHLTQQLAAHLQAVRAVA